MVAERLSALGRDVPADAALAGGKMLRTVWFDDLRAVLRLAAGRKAEPTAAIHK